MTNYDEYQKFIRYKYGHHAFLLVLVLVLINFWFSLFRDLQWAETKELEIILLIFVAVIYSVLMNIYHGAYFTRKQSPQLYSLLFFGSGLLNLYLALSPYRPLIVDGQITMNSIMVVNGIFLILIPAAYMTKVLVDIRREKDE